MAQSPVTSDQSSFSSAPAGATSASAAGEAGRATGRTACSVGCPGRERRRGLFSRLARGRQGRLFGLGALGALALTAALLGRVPGALAQDGDEGRGPHFGMMQRMINSRVDDALDAIKATPQQRTAIYAVRDRLVAEAKKEMAGGREKHQQDLEAVLTLFTADRFDMAKANALKDQHRAEAQAHWQSMADAAVQGIADVHAVLTPAQRQALAQYVREHRGHGPGRGGHPGGRGPGAQK